MTTLSRGMRRLRRYWPTPRNPTCCQYGKKTGSGLVKIAQGGMNLLHLHSSASDQLRYLLILAEPLFPESIEYFRRLHNPVADVYARYRIARAGHVAKLASTCARPTEQIGVAVVRCGDCGKHIGCSIFTSGSPSR
jgi:hypothetical protein